MPRKDSIYRTINTIDGTTIHFYQDDKGLAKAHSSTGPAIMYSKAQGMSDEYYLYGIKYNYDRWLELSRPLRRASAGEDLQD